MKKESSTQFSSYKTVPESSKFIDQFDEAKKANFVGQFNRPSGQNFPSSETQIQTQTNQQKIYYPSQKNLVQSTSFGDQNQLLQSYFQRNSQTSAPVSQFSQNQIQTSTIARSEFIPQRPIQTQTQTVITRTENSNQNLQRASQTQTQTVFTRNEIQNQTFQRPSQTQTQTIITKNDIPNLNLQSVTRPSQSPNRILSSKQAPETPHFQPVNPRPTISTPIDITANTKFAPAPLLNQSTTFQAQSSQNQFTQTQNYQPRPQNISPTPNKSPISNENPSTQAPRSQTPPPLNPLPNPLQFSATQQRPISSSSNQLSNANTQGISSSNDIRIQQLNDQSKGNIPSSHLIQYEVDVEGVGKYKGQLINGKFNGLGELIDLDGSVLYKGWFVENEFEGVGVAYNGERKMKEGNVDFASDLGLVKDAWEKYEGEFHKSRYNGVGQLFLLNGESFFGEFKNGKADGYGVYYLKTGSKIAGFWKHNRLVEKI